MTSVPNDRLGPVPTLAHGGQPPTYRMTLAPEVRFTLGYVVLALGILFLVANITFKPETLTWSELVASGGVVLVLATLGYLLQLLEAAPRRLAKRLHPLGYTIAVASFGEEPLIVNHANDNEHRFDSGSIRRLSRTRELWCLPPAWRFSITVSAQGLAEAQVLQTVQLTFSFGLNHLAARMNMTTQESRDKFIAVVAPTLSDIRGGQSVTTNEHLRQLIVRLTSHPSLASIGVTRVAIAGVEDPNIPAGMPAPADTGRIEL